MGSPAFNPSGAYTQPAFDPSAGFSADSGTPPKAEPEGFWHSLGAQFGVTPEAAQQKVAEFKAHPLLSSIPGADIVKGLIRQVQQTGGELSQAYQQAKQGNAASAAVHAIQAVPIVGPAMSKAADQYADKDYLGEAGTLTGAAAGAAPIVAGGVESAGGNIISPEVGPALSDAAAAAKMKLRPTSSPAIVAPETIQAQKIAQSILPPGGIKPALVDAIQNEAPAVKEYAQRTGNPLNTQAEGLAAAQGLAKEGLQHFNDNILSPVADQRVVLPSGTELGASATLGEVSSEITRLNRQVSAAKAANSGDALTILSKGGVQDQLDALRSTLYDNLSQKTGIAPDQLQALREGYGGQFTMADGLESAQNARLTRTGRASQGVAAIGSVPTSLADIPGKFITAARGGEQAIADRQFGTAMRDVQPQAPNRPLPQAAVQTPPTGSALWAQQGATKLIQAGLTQNDIDVLGRTGPGKQMLMDASGLTPGSAAFKALVQQIKGAK